MKRFRLAGCAALALGGALLCGTIVAPTLPYGAIGPRGGAQPSGFAADLAQRSSLTGASAWVAIPERQAWDRLTAAATSERQAARWDCARSRIAAERGPEAVGVLEVMRQDDPDLGMVDARRLAHNAALVQVGRSGDALAELDLPGLRANLEVCLWRLRALSDAGLADQGRLRFARVAQSGNAPQRMDARLSHLEGDVARKAIAAAAVLKQLDAIRYSWRGDAMEERALRRAYVIADARGDLAETLSADAALVRYHDAAAQQPERLAGLRAKLSDALGSAPNLPLDKAAGLHWYYRDIAPSGAEGDLMASRLAGRLLQAGLYERGGGPVVVPTDAARGRSGARAAFGAGGGLYILAGRPERAMRTVRETDVPGLPDAMEGECKRVEAAALVQVGRPDEAMAVLQYLPG